MVCSPTPPEAPVISTVSSSCTPLRVRSTWRAVPMVQAQIDASSIASPSGTRASPCSSETT